MNDLEEVTICLYQLNRPKVSINNDDKSGDCYNCQYDPVNNKKCGSYYPIKLYY